MTQYALPAVYALFVWWFGTGLALYIVGRARETHRWSMLGAVAVFAASLYALQHAAADAGSLGVYAAFTLAILVWGAIEVSFLTGLVTGPIRSACPRDRGPWLRAAYAIGAILWHELLLIATGAAIVAITWGLPNQIGGWTFALLWTMRLSTKLNLFLGVPILNDQFLPEPVAHLKSYFLKGPVSLFFPVSVTLATVLTILLAEGSLIPGVIPAEGLMLLATLSALAVLEHWFMVVPLPLEALWRWSLKSEKPAVLANAASVVTIVRTAQGAGTRAAFEAWAAPVISIRDAGDGDRAGKLGNRKNVLPHPALSRQRRRP